MTHFFKKLNIFSVLQRAILRCVIRHGLNANYVKQFNEMAQPRPLFVYFRYFQTQIEQKKH